MAVKSLKRSTLETGFVTDNSMNAGYSFQDFHHIETIQLGGSATSVSFINLDKYAGEYKHLQIRMIARSSGTAQNDIALKINSDAGSNYSYHHLQGVSSSVVSGSASSSSFGSYIGVSSNANSSSGAYGLFVIDILDFASTTKFKTTRSLFGDTGISRVGLVSSLWQNTSSISQIDFVSYSTAWATGSRFSLYGIR